MQCSKKPCTNQLEIHFFHGFLGDPQDWSPVKTRLDISSCYTHRLGEPIELNAPSLLIGYSMGGRVALKTYFDNPGCVQGVILLSTGLGLSDKKLREDRNDAEKKWIEQMTLHGMPQFVDWWYSMPLFDEFKKCSQFNEVIARRKQLQIDDAKKQLHNFSILQMENYWEKISEISIPIYFLFGDRDTRYRSVFKKCGALPKQYISGSGHVLHLEAPEMCAHLINRFIKDNYG